MNKELKLDMVYEILYSICLYTQKNKKIDGMILNNIDDLCSEIMEEIEKLSDNTIDGIMINLIKISKMFGLKEDVLTAIENKLQRKLEKLKKLVIHKAPKPIILNECVMIGKLYELHSNIISYYK